MPAFQMSVHRLQDQRPQPPRVGLAEQRLCYIKERPQSLQTQHILLVQALLQGAGYAAG